MSCQLAVTRCRVREGGETGKLRLQRFESQAELLRFFAEHVEVSSKYDVAGIVPASRWEDAKRKTGRDAAAGRDAYFLPLDVDGAGGQGVAADRLEALAAKLRAEGIAFALTSTFSSSTKAAPGHWRVHLVLLTECMADDAVYRATWAAWADAVSDLLDTPVDRVGQHIACVTYPPTCPPGSPRLSIVHDGQPVPAEVPSVMQRVRAASIDRTPKHPMPMAARVALLRGLELVLVQPEDTSGHLQGMRGLASVQQITFSAIELGVDLPHLLEYVDAEQRGAWTRQACREAFEHVWHDVSGSAPAWESELPPVGRARIDLGLKFDDVVDRSVEALSRVPVQECRVWRHGGQLVRADLSSYTTPALRTELSRAIDYVRSTEDGEKTVHPPRDVAESVGAADCSAVREIVGISRVPLLRPDGELVTARGYDSATKLWLEPIDVEVGHTREHAEAAAVLLLDAVGDVQWLDAEVDPWVWLAHVLTVAARHLCSTVPVWIYDADRPGAGKTTIARAAGLIGGRCSVVFNAGFGGDEAELVRSIDPHASGAALVLDNLRGRIASPALEAALTSGILRVRRLYVGHCDVALRAVVSLTGNDAQTGSDWARRSLPCLLERRRELDGARELLEELDDPRFTAAALTILRAWLRVGGVSQATSLPSFRAWSQLVPGAIAWLAGVDVVGATRERAAELTTSENTTGLVDAVADFLHWKQWSERGATASEMLEGGASYALEEDPGAKLLAILQRGSRGTVTPVTVGSMLRDASGADPRLQQFGSRRDGRRWRVVTVDGDGGDGDPEGVRHH
ncbi:MAG: hypothetical protein IPH07_24590 [Deltaproteobacteria bacterium]|nr:hypothetical protein [Deltaproteobacteria bacterium]